MTLQIAKTWKGSDIAELSLNLLPGRYDVYQSLIMLRYQVTKVYVKYIHSQMLICVKLAVNCAPKQDYLKHVERRSLL